MLSKQSNNIQTYAIGGILLLALLAYYLAFQENPLLLGGLVLLIGLVAVVFTRPEIGLPAFLVIRPLVDSIGEYRITFGGFGINIAGALSLLAIVWSLWVLYKKRANLWRFELFRSMLLLVVLSVFSLSYTWDRTATMTELIRIIGFFLLYLVARVLVTDWVAFRRLAVAFAVSFVIPGIVAIAQVATGSGLTFAESYNRAYGTFGHPNVLAFITVIGLSYFLTSWPLLALRPASRWPFMLFLGLVLFLTQTRGAWLGAIVSLAVIGLIRFRRLFAAGLLVAVMVAVSLPTINIITTNVFGVDLQTVPGTREIIARRAERSSYQWRLDVWKEMGRKFTERPVFGFGLGAFPAVRELQVFDFFQGVGAHNDYLRLLIELGTLGIGAYIAFLLGLFIHLGRAYRRLQQHPLSFPILGMIGFSAAFVLMSIFDNLLQSTAVMWAFMIMLGATLNLVEKRKKL